MRPRPVPAALALATGLAATAAVAAAAPATSSAIAPAAAPAPLEPATPLEAPAQSWLIDHTRSEIGGAFYRAFASAWRQQPRGGAVISVEEQMRQPFAHEIRIWVGGRLLLQTQLYPSQRGDLARLAESAADSAASRLRAWQAPREVIL